MSMVCENCGQRSDWIGEDSDWSPMSEGGAVALEMYECDHCGHRQRVK